MSDDRDLDRTAPPSTIGYPAPDGGLIFAVAYRRLRPLVTDPYDTVGAIWVTERPQVPRAGIVNIADPDGPFQDDLAPVAFRLRRSIVDASDALALLGASRNGVGTTLLLGPPTPAASLDVVRAAIGR